MSATIKRLFAVESLSSSRAEQYLWNRFPHSTLEAAVGSIGIVLYRVIFFVLACRLYLGFVHVRVSQHKISIFSRFDTWDFPWPANEMFVVPLLSC